MVITITTPITMPIIYLSIRKIHPPCRETETCRIITNLNLQIKIITIIPICMQINTKLQIPSSLISLIPIEIIIIIVIMQLIYLIIIFKINLVLSTNRRLLRFNNHLTKNQIQLKIRIYWVQVLMLLKNKKMIHFGNFPIRI